MVNQTYADVRQWLATQRQANGGQLAGLDTRQDAASELIFLSASVLTVAHVWKSVSFNPFRIRDKTFLPGVVLAGGAARAARYPVLRGVTVAALIGSSLLLMAKSPRAGSRSRRPRR